MNIAITGGGTGGHLVIAKALAIELNARGIKPIFIGSMYGQDRSWFEGSELFSATYFLHTRGVVNQNFFGKLYSLYLIKMATFKSLWLFRTHHITKVISVGGFSAAPASFASILSGKDFYIHEQNSVTGKLNAILRHFAKRFFSSYEPPFYDYPVSNAYFEGARVRESLKCIIFLGGSQGAKAINDLALAIAPTLHQKGITIIHQCGAKEEERVRAEYAKMGIEAEVYGFTKELPALIKRADFAVCRSGASTVWELAATHLPALYIPYPHAAANHQYHNAEFIVKNHGAMLIEQQCLDPKAVEVMLEMMEINTMSKALGEMITHEGTRKIIDEIMS